MKKLTGKQKRIGNAGVTLVETLAAFVVLMIILAIFYKIVDFSATLRDQAVDTAHLNQMFMREIYKNDDKIDSAFVQTTYFSKDGGDGEAQQQSGFWLVLDTEKTDINRNYLYDAYRTEESAILDNPPIFRLDHTEAISYKCIDPLIEEEQLPIPAAMNFRYVEPEEETP